MAIDQNQFKQMMLQVAKVWNEQHTTLSEIDSRFGDGDHGVTIRKIAGLIERKVSEWEDQRMYEWLDELGTDIMAVSGGSAGPLYGTLVSGLAEPLEGITQIDGPVLKAMFQSSLEAMEDITKARVGDKTMMDALIPAVHAAGEAGEDISLILQAAKDAALKGAKDSEQYISKFGRAKSYKEQTIGTPDAGAVSTSLLFVALAEGFH